MTKLAWATPVNARYELGVDRAVFYPMVGSGVPWNGVVSVTENIMGAERNERFIDGFKYYEDIGAKNYQATVKAFYAPKEFDPCVGLKDIARGVSLTGQPRSTFNFTYRTQIGTLGYKIHLVYNITATPSARAYATTTKSSATPLIFEWKFDAVPPSTRLFKATPHLIVDSTKATPANLALLEAMLYGTSTAEPFMPDVDSVINLFAT